MDNVKNSFEELKNLLLSAVDLMENIGEELETRVLVMEKKLLEMERRMEEYESIKKTDGFEDILSAGGVVSAADMVGEGIVAEDVAVEDDEFEIVEDRACGADIGVVAVVEPVAEEIVEAAELVAEEVVVKEEVVTAAEEVVVAAAEEVSAAVVAVAAAKEGEEAAEEEMFEFKPELVTEEPVIKAVAVVEPVAEEIVEAAESAAEEVVAEEEVAMAAKTENDEVRAVETSALGATEDEIVAAVEDEKTDDIYTERVAAETNVIKEETGTISVNDAAKPDWYDWEVDYPAAYIDDIYKGISFNDRYEFVKELFNVTGNLSEAEIVFKETLDDINCMDNFKEVVAYIRHRFPQWDEQSDEVYRFYMIVRRKFNN